MPRSVSTRIWRIGSRQPQTLTSFSSWPNSRLSPGAHLVLTKGVKGSDLQDIEGALHLEGQGCPPLRKSLLARHRKKHARYPPFLHLTHLGRDLKGEEVEAPGGQGLHERAWVVHGSCLGTGALPSFSPLSSAVPPLLPYLRLLDLSQSTLPSFVSSALPHFCLSCPISPSLPDQCPHQHSVLKLLGLRL